jgi:hypothetical protein
MPLTPKEPGKTVILPVWPETIADAALFNGTGDSLSRTPAGDESDLTKWTFSCWFKHTGTSGIIGLRASTHPTDSYEAIALRNYASSGLVQIFVGTGTGDTYYMVTEASFPDQTAWYHLVVVFDSAQAEATDRVRLFVNGVRVTDFVEDASIQWPAENTTSALTMARLQAVAVGTGQLQYPYGGCLARVEFLSGVAVDAPAFGLFSNSVTGLWAPQVYSGPYGDNGFKLAFANAAAMGEDTSGNNNSFSVTGAPVQTADTPTNNHCTLNPLVSLDSTITYSKGNLRISGGDSVLTTGSVAGTLEMTSGKYYAEVYIEALGTRVDAGVITPDIIGSNVTRIGVLSCVEAEGWATGDRVGVAVDVENRSIDFYKNGIFYSSVAITADGPFLYYGALGIGRPCAAVWNFGATGFTYDPPEGHVALCAINQPDPLVMRSATVADVVQRTGTGAVASVAHFTPDLIITKSTSTATGWPVFDSARGDNVMVRLDVTDAPSAVDGISFTSTGYAVGTLASLNANDEAFIDICLRAGSDTGFAIVSDIEHTSGAATSFAHPLGKPVTFALARSLSTGVGFHVFHTALGEDAYLQVASTDAADASLPGFWAGNTSTTFSISEHLPTGTYIAYLFTDSDIFRAFSYTGNAAADGPFVPLGGRPLAIPFLKHSGADTDWRAFTALAAPHNPVAFGLRPNLAAAQSAATLGHFLSAGLKVTATGTGINGSGGLMIGLAILQSTNHSNAY